MDLSDNIYTDMAARAQLDVPVMVVACASLVIALIVTTLTCVCCDRRRSGSFNSRRDTVPLDELLSKPSLADPESVFSEAGSYDLPRSARAASWMRMSGEASSIARDSVSASALSVDEKGQSTFTGAVLLSPPPDVPAKWNVQSHKTALSDQTDKPQLPLQRHTFNSKHVGQLPPGETQTIMESGRSGDDFIHGLNRGVKAAGAVRNYSHKDISDRVRVHSAALKIHRDSVTRDSVPFLSSARCSFSHEAGHIVHGSKVARTSLPTTEEQTDVCGQRLSCSNNEGRTSVHTELSLQVHTEQTSSFSESASDENTAGSHTGRPRDSYPEGKLPSPDALKYSGRTQRYNSRDLTSSTGQDDDPSQPGPVPMRRCMSCVHGDGVCDEKLSSPRRKTFSLNLTIDVHFESDRSYNENHSKVVCSPSIDYSNCGKFASALDKCNARVASDNCTTSLASDKYEKYATNSNCILQDQTPSSSTNTNEASDRVDTDAKERLLQKSFELKSQIMNSLPFVAVHNLRSDPPIHVNSALKECNVRHSSSVSESCSPIMALPEVTNLQVVAPLAVIREQDRRRQEKHRSAGSSSSGRSDEAAQFADKETLAGSSSSGRYVEAAQFADKETLAGSSSSGRYVEAAQFADKETLAGSSSSGRYDEAAQFADKETLQNIDCYPPDVVNKNIPNQPGNDDVTFVTRDITPGTRDITPGTRDITPGTRDITPGTRDITPGTTVRSHLENTWSRDIPPTVDLDMDPVTRRLDVTPTPLPDITPAHRPDITPTHRPDITPTTRPDITPTPRPDITPSPRPNITPSPRPEITPTARPDITPSPRPDITPTARPEITPTARPDITPSPRPEITPTARPDITPSPRPDITPSPRPDITQTARPDITPITGPDITPTTGPDITPTTGPDITSEASSGHPHTHVDMVDARPDIPPEASSGHPHTHVDMMDARPALEAENEVDPRRWTSEDGKISGLQDCHRRAQTVKKRYGWAMAEKDDSADSRFMRASSLKVHSSDPRRHYTSQSSTQQRRNVVLLMKDDLTSCRSFVDGESMLRLDSKETQETQGLGSEDHQESRMKQLDIQEDKNSNFQKQAINVTQELYKAETEKTTHNQNMAKFVELNTAQVTKQTMHDGAEIFGSRSAKHNKGSATLSDQEPLRCTSDSAAGQEPYRSTSDSAAVIDPLQVSDDSDYDNPWDDLDDAVKRASIRYSRRPSRIAAGDTKTLLLKSAEDLGRLLEEADKRRQLRQARNSYQMMSPECATESMTIPFTRYSPHRHTVKGIVTQTHLSTSHSSEDILKAHNPTYPKLSLLRQQDQPQQGGKGIDVRRPMSLASKVKAKVASPETKKRKK